ncbi:MAG: dihydrodipicolinate reductase C-terminal domain-containing protein [Pseudomonadota bacterium]
MQVLIVGTGKLATELLQAPGLGAAAAAPVLPWTDRDQNNTAPAIVVHAGSGRELQDAIAYCQASRSVLVELATGSDADAPPQGFPVVVCPNTNILMLKFMHMLETSGHLFKGYAIELTESHQQQKTSVPGTAVSMAQSLGLADGAVRSVRDPQQQAAQLRIPAEHLARHAYHHIVIEDPVCSVTLETRVYGASPYAEGVARILAAIRAHALEDRMYLIDEFVERGWV